MQIEYKVVGIEEISLRECEKRRDRELGEARGTLIFRGRKEE